MKYLRLYTIKQENRVYIGMLYEKLETLTSGKYEIIRQFTLTYPDFLSNIIRNSPDYRKTEVVFMREIELSDSTWEISRLYDSLVPSGLEIINLITLEQICSLSR